MADSTPAKTPLPASPEPSSPHSSAVDQARIRRERREAKIKAGGSARLNKITGLGGGLQRDAPPQPAAAAPSMGDPEEVDISQHYYTPNTTSRPRIPSQQQQPETQITDEQLRAMMLGFPPSGRGTPPQDGPGAAPNPFLGEDNPFMGMGMGMGGGPGSPGGGADDPVLKLLQQMMSGMGGAGMPGEGPGAGGIPPFPGMGSMGAGIGMPGMPGMPGQTAAADPYAHIWRIIHAIFALALGLYVALTAEFTGTKLARDISALDTSASTTWAESRIRFFYIFATVEVILQTSRFFLEKGVVQQGGISGMLVGFLPEPWRGYLMIIMRYRRIWTTVSADAMVCVFVLGVCAWWRMEGA